MGYMKKVHYRLDPAGEGASKAISVMGVALFIRIAYFFGFSRLESAGFFMLTFGLILPLLIETAMIVMLKGVRISNPGLYALLGAVLCLMLFFQCFRYDGILRMILGFAAYLVCGCALIGMVSGYLTNGVAKWIFFGVAAGRFLFFNLFQNVFGLHPVALLFEATAIFDLLALGFFAGALDHKK